MSGSFSRDVNEPFFRHFFALDLRQFQLFGFELLIYLLVFLPQAGDLGERKSKY